MDQSPEKYAKLLFEQNTIRRPEQGKTKTKSAAKKARLALPLEDFSAAEAPDLPAATLDKSGLQPLPRHKENTSTDSESPLSALRAHKVAHLNHLLNISEKQPPKTEPVAPKSSRPEVKPAPVQKVDPELEKELRASQARLKRTQLQLDMAHLLLENHSSLETCMEEVLSRLLKRFGLWAGALRTPAIGHPVRPQRLQLQKMQRRIPEWPQPGTFKEKAPEKPLHKQHRNYQQWVYGIHHHNVCWGQLALAYSPAQSLSAEEEIALQTLIDDLGFYLSAWNDQQQQLSQQDHDPLTGLLNHTSFQQALEKELKTRTQYPLSLVVLNLDLLRQINEVHGFEQGDKALQAVAKLLSTPAFLNIPVSRFGPESFLFLCPQTTAAEAAKQAESLRLSIAQLSLPGKYNSSLGLTASFGIVSLEGPTQKAQQTLLEQAFVALEYAKTQGRNQVQVFQPEWLEAQLKTPETKKEAQPPTKKAPVKANVKAPAKTAPETRTPVRRAEARKWSDILASQQDNITEVWQEKTDDYSVKEVSDAVKQLQGRLGRLLNSLCGLLDQSTKLEDLAQMPISYFMPSPVVAAIRRGSANHQLISYEVAFMLLQESLLEVLKQTSDTVDSLEPAIEAFFHCINEKMTQLKNEVKR